MERKVQQYKDKRYDLIVVGGGIQGTTIAREAARRGFSVALLEQDDWGSATSANSQRMIHGGARYLQNADFKRLRRSVRDRRELMHLAPHLIHPVPILTPTYGYGMKGRFVMRCGMLLYDMLSLDRNRGIAPDRHIPRHQVLSPDHCLKLESRVNRNGLTGAIVFYDTMVRNSERLTLQFAKEASQLGAHLSNYVKVEQLIVEDSRAKGVRARDRLTGREITVRGDLVITAAGPLTSKLTGHKVNLIHTIALLTRSVHDQYALAIPGSRIHDPAAIERRGRYYFITPWRGFSLVGMGEWPVDGDPEVCQTGKETVIRLLEEINAAIPGANLRYEDVKRVFSGLLPAATEDKTVLSRRDQVIDHGSEGGLFNVISVVGVKYTTALSLARRVLDLVCDNYGYEGEASTGRTRESLSSFDINAHLEEAERKYGKLMEPTSLKELLYLYGTDYMKVLSLVEDNSRWAEQISSHPPLYAAQVVFSIQEEMAVRLSDVVVRRTELGMFGLPEIGALRKAADLMAAEMGWDEPEKAKQIAHVEEEFLPIQRQ
jgi:glycerol-3-phosphate dehydrogenase